MNFNDLQPLVPETLEGVLDCENDAAMYDTAAIADELRELGIDRDGYLHMDREERAELMQPLWERARLDEADLCNGYADEIVAALNPGLNPVVTRASYAGPGLPAATVSVGDRTVTIGLDDDIDGINIRFGDEDWSDVNGATQYLTAA